ncbi:transcription factor tau 131 kDa subunit [Diutina catenulata]
MSDDGNSSDAPYLDEVDSDPQDESFHSDDADIEMDNFIDDFRGDNLRDDEPAVSNPEPIVWSDDDMDDGEASDDYDENYDLMDALRGANNFRVKNKSAASRNYYKRKMMKSDKKLDPEVRQALSQANEAFTRKDYLVAQAKYQEVIQKDNQNFFAYKTLGEICKIQGRLDQCCNYWFLAANIHSWDTQFWGTVAELSTQLNYIDQAIHCYSKAITPDIAKSTPYILERANLYREKRNYGRALDGLNKVRRQFPQNPEIIKQIASIYLDTKRLNDALNMYWEILNKNISADPNAHPETRDFVTFGWAELNIMLELFTQQRAWKGGINVIKVVSRWMQHRTQEKWWDDADDDAEFDQDRRFMALERLSSTQRQEALQKDYSLHIDIRYRMGIFRLELGQKDEALHHFRYLFDEVDVDDLFLEAGRSLEEHGLYKDAIEYLSRACVNEELQQTPELYTLLGKCFLETGQYKEAKQAFQNSMVLEPDEPEHYMSLVETYHYLHDEAEALKCIDSLQKLLRQRAELHQEPWLEDNEHDLNEAIIKSQQYTRKGANVKLSDEERQMLEIEATRKVTEKYRRMERLSDSIVAGDRVAIKTWCQYASHLIDTFTSIKSFFPKDKNREFKGIVQYRRKKNLKLEERLSRLYNLVEGAAGGPIEEEQQSRHMLTSTTEFRGLTYVQWFDIFCQYAVLLAHYEDSLEEGKEILELAKTVNVFVQDKSREAFLHLMELHFALMNKDMNEVSKVVRYFLNMNQFSPFIYKFFTCCFSHGIHGWEHFANYNHQKFFLRQLKAYDAVINNTKITGMATVSATEIKNNRDKLGVELPDLTYMYSNLLGGARSYSSPVVYMNRVYKHYPSDPMVCLMLGLAHVHRSMQRLSSNRHMQLLQGISYIMEYRQHRLGPKASDYEKQEVEYNFGRLFHMLGLLSLAVVHYSNVFDFANIDERFDMSSEAAYNLALIYNLNGNSQLAREITARYLTI